MLRIRLRRVGKKGKPSYRIVVAEVTAPRDGKYLEWIGNYDPMADPPAITIKEDRAIQWLAQGAQPSDAVVRILSKRGILQRTHASRAAASSSTGETAQVEAPVVTAVATADGDQVERAVEVEASVQRASDEAPAGETSDEDSEE